MPKSDVTLGSAGNGVTLGSQILCQFALHLCGSIEGHRIVSLVQFRQKPNPVTLYESCRLVAIFVVLKSLFGIKAAHTHVEAWLLGVTMGICGADLP